MRTSSGKNDPMEAQGPRREDILELVVHENCSSGVYLRFAEDMLVEAEMGFA